jgi:hypothetical protein
MESRQTDEEVFANGAVNEDGSSGVVADGSASGGSASGQVEDAAGGDSGEAYHMPSCKLFVFKFPTKR